MSSYNSTNFQADVGVSKMIPSREWIHIPPWEKENHLQNAIFGGYVSFLEGISLRHKTTWYSTQPIMKNMLLLMESFPQGWLDPLKPPPPCDKKVTYHCEKTRLAQQPPLPRHHGVHWTCRAGSLMIDPSTETWSPTFNVQPLFWKNKHTPLYSYTPLKINGWNLKSPLFLKRRKSSELSTSIVAFHVNVPGCNQK